jgi:hypothetical protein
MIYCTICKDYFKIDHDDLWDCIVVYEEKNNQVGKTMKTWIDNLQKKDKVEYESAYSKWSKSLKSKNVQ